MHDGKEENSMSTEAGVFPRSSLPIPPPGYEQCVGKPAAPRAEYVVSPIVVAALFAWDDEDD